MKLIDALNRVGTAGKKGSKFTGAVHSFLTMSGTDGVTINTVNFSPGSRTYWHTHEQGQILQILAGEGLVGTDSEGVHVLRPGDTVWCPPGERHWHGAATHSFMTHTAISLGHTSWAEEVTASTYQTQTSIPSTEG